MKQIGARFSDIGGALLTFSTASGLVPSVTGEGTVAVSWELSISIATSRRGDLAVFVGLVLLDFTGETLVFLGGGVSIETLFRFVPFCEVCGDGLLLFLDDVTLGETPLARGETPFFDCVGVGFLVTFVTFGFGRGLSEHSPSLAWTPSDDSPALGFALFTDFPFLAVAVATFFFFPLLSSSSSLVKSKIFKPESDGNDYGVSH